MESSIYVKLASLRDEEDFMCRVYCHELCGRQSKSALKRRTGDDPNNTVRRDILTDIRSDKVDTSWKSVL
jgi:hypothetical protein